LFAGASLDENSGAFCELKANFFRLILTKAELIGLTYNDVNLEKKELYVTHQLTYRNYQDGEGCKFRIKKTKTDAVLYALKDFLIKWLGSLLEHTT
jgi:hypothetical protein